MSYCEGEVSPPGAIMTRITTLLVDKFTKMWRTLWSNFWRNLWWRQPHKDRFSSKKRKFSSLLLRIRRRKPEESGLVFWSQKRTSCTLIMFSCCWLSITNLGWTKVGESSLATLHDEVLSSEHCLHHYFMSSLWKSLPMTLNGAYQEWCSLGAMCSQTPNSH